MDIKIKWYKIGDDQWIAKVIGGWVLREQDTHIHNENLNRDREYNRGRRDQIIIPPVTMVFIPDLEHRWEAEYKINKLLRSEVGE